MASRRRVAGLRSLGAESLAVRADGLVFTSALGASAIGQARDAGPQAAMAATAVEEALGALGASLDRVAKRKSFVADMRALPEIEAALGEHLARAPATSVGAALPHPADRLAIEVVAGVDEAPTFTGNAARLNDLVFTAGCGAFDAAGALVGLGDLSAQGFRALENVVAALRAAGADHKHLLKINNTTASWHDYALYNAAYNVVLAGSNAARCSVSGALENPLALIAIEGVAWTGDDAPRFVDSTRSGVGRTDFSRRADTVYLPDIGPCKGPHSHASRAGNIVFVAGECPYDADDRLVEPGDVEAQTLRTLENVRLGLEALGASLGDVVKTSVSLSDQRLRDGFERAWRKVFAPPFPARSVIATPLGQYGILVEIEAIAIVGAEKEFALGAGG